MVYFSFLFPLPPTVLFVFRLFLLSFTLQITFKNEYNTGCFKMFDNITKMGNFEMLAIVTVNLPFSTHLNDLID